MSGGAGRFAIIAGGLGGLGVAIGKALRRQGYHLALLYAPFERAKVEVILKSEYGVEEEVPVTDITTYGCDITKAISVSLALVKINDHLERYEGKLLPSVLVNAAGYISLSPFGTMPTDEIVKHLHVNLLGPMLVAQYFSSLFYTFKQMYNDKMPPGRIVNIASQAAHVALDQHGPYCASKAGLIGATRSMALEWSDLGITSNSISPGPVMTDLGKRAWADDETREAYLAQVPTGVFAEAEEIAATTLFLCSDEAKNINGIDIRIDGGFTAR